jgi:tyrosine-protein kinase Etk/Wzc
MMQATKPAHDTEKKHLLDYCIVLARKWKIIVTASALVTVLVYLILFFSPNKYQAMARLMPPQQNLTLSAQLLDSLGGSTIPGKSPASGLGSMAAGLLGLRVPGELFVSIMDGETISDRIIARFHLQKVFREKYPEDARKKLQKMVELGSSREGIITIKITDKDPQRAAAIANAYITELEKLLQEIAVTEAQAHLAFLEKEHAQANVNLTKAEEALRSFSEKNSVVQIDTQTKGMLEYIANLRAVIDTKEVQVKVLRQQAAPTNYDVIRLETELKGLREKLRAAETKWDQDCIGDVCLNTSRVPALGLEYLRLYRDLKFREGVYQLYTKMVEIARLDVVKDVATIQVIDHAKPPMKRSNKRAIPALLGGIATFLLMTLVILGREHLHELKKDEDTAHRLSILAGCFKPLTDKLKQLTRLRK